jgi:hypothetical protein
MADIGNSDLPGAVIPRTQEGVTGTSTPLRFPAEIERYFTIIKFVQYKRKNPKVGAIRVNQADIVLPLPQNLREFYAVTYGDVEFDKLGGVTDSTEKLINEYLDKGMTTEVLDGAIDASIGFGEAMARRTANFFSDDAGALIDRVQGNIVNPHITAVFRGVGLREHSFTWRLSAKTAEESRTLRAIINYVRDHMHPLKRGDFLLDFPDEVYVSFFAENKPFLYPMFKSVITSIDVPSSTDGTNAFFRGTDEPVVIDLTIQFKEVEAVTREDFQANTSANSTIAGTGSPAVEVRPNSAGTGVR